MNIILWYLGYNFGNNFGRQCGETEYLNTDTIPMPRGQ